MVDDLATSNLCHALVRNLTHLERSGYVSLPSCENNLWSMKNLLGDLALQMWLQGFHRRILLRSVMIAAITIKSKRKASSNVGSDGAGLRATYG
jgi:hypothetical protein